MDSISESQRLQRRIGIYHKTYFELPKNSEIKVLKRLEKKFKKLQSINF